MFFSVIEVRNFIHFSPRECKELESRVSCGYILGLSGECLRHPVGVNDEMTSGPRIGVLEKSTDMNVFRRLGSIVRKPRESASRANGSGTAASGGDVSDRPLYSGGVPDLMPIVCVVVAEVRVSEETGSRVFVIGQMIGGKTKRGVVHVVVVNLLRVHGTDQVRHLSFVYLRFCCI